MREHVFGVALQLLQCLVEVVALQVERQPGHPLVGVAADVVDRGRGAAAERHPGPPKSTNSPANFPALAHLQAKRLGVVPLEIDTGHSPWLSKPAEFAALLVEATKTKPVGPLIPTSLHVKAEHAG